MVSTPCIRICTLDPAGRLCLGCGRTVAEIGAWGGMDEAARKAVMAVLPARLSLYRQGLACVTEAAR